jgi:oligopeptide/dipeptide ABC transporter ATP-binding protein
MDEDKGKRQGKLLKVESMSKLYPIRSGILRRVSGYVTAVKNVSFNLGSGETLGLVGESGCGKSTCGKCVCRLELPTEGKVEFHGVDISRMAAKELKTHRRGIQMIFQNPYASLDPRMTVRRILDEPIRVNFDLDPVTRENRIMELLDMVGLNPGHAGQYPHEFSGGQRQRIAIARAISVGPSVIIADEAVSALDVSVQSQILNLMTELKRKLGLSYLFISHNLSVIKHMSDRVLVMYLGRIVENARSSEIFDSPLHPYTRALLSAIPRPGVFENPERIILNGDVPSPDNPPGGCVFHTRCPEATPLCAEEEPVPVLANESGRSVTCHHYKDRGYA